MYHVDTSTPNSYKVYGICAKYTQFIKKIWNPYGKYGIRTKAMEFIKKIWVSKEKYEFA